MTQAEKQIQNNRLAAYRAQNLPAGESRLAYVNLMVRDYNSACDDSVRDAIIAQIKYDHSYVYCFAVRDGKLVSKVAA